LLIPTQLTRSQALAFRTSAINKNSMLLTSKAGFGKSFVLKLILTALEEEGYRVLRCASSGKAASSIKGATVHRSAGMGTGTKMVLPKDVPPEPKLWLGVKRKPLLSAIASASMDWLAPKLVCAIDEIYQLSSANGRLWYDIGTALRATSKVPLPAPIFIFAGDIGQFLPIEGDLIFEPAKFSYYNQRGLVEYLTLPSILEEIPLVKVELQENMRQADPKIRKALDWLYYGVAVHPMILDRVQAAPANTPTFYFNNALVKTENEQRLVPYKGNSSRVYTAVGETLTEAEIKSLLPITERMEIHVGAPFTITSNIFDGKDLSVANGEVVTVTALNRQSLTVKKKSGKVIDLPYVQQYLPRNQSNGKSKTYMTLPGYPGDSCSLMKTQGETFSHEVCYAAWQLMRGQVHSLSSQPGALYTMCSRVVDISLLFFDTSMGIEQAKKLLQKALVVSPKVLNFLLDNKRPLWATDKFKQEVVVELQGPFEFASDHPEILALKYEVTSLQTGTEQQVVALFQQPSLKLLSAQEIIEDKFTQVNYVNYLDLFEDLAIIYSSDY
jgi:AAA domain